MIIRNNKLKMAINFIGIYINGSRLNDISSNVIFANFVAQKTAQIGSIEGSKRSNATYNEISIYNRVLSEEELKTLTRIETLSE